MPARPLLGLLLSAVAGYVDAIGWLILGGTFVAFMSGNTTRLGIALAGGEPVTGWALVILGFLGGACAGALLRDAAGPRLALPLLLATESGLLALAASAGQEAALLAAAMGLQNLARQAVAGAQPGTTFVTGTLVSLGQALADALRGRPGPALAAQAATWGALLAGTVAGAAVAGWAGAGPALAVAPLLPAALAAFALSRRR